MPPASSSWKRSHACTRSNANLTRRAAPVLWIYVGDRLRERPATPREVLDCVLPLAERVVGRRIQHTSPMASGVLVMAIDVFHPHHHGVGIFASSPALFSD